VRRSWNCRCKWRVLGHLCPVGTNYGWDPSGPWDLRDKKMTYKSHKPHVSHRTCRAARLCDNIGPMVSPYTFQPRGRLLDVMRQVGDPDLINLAAGLPSVHCVPKSDLQEAFAATLAENADEALGYHVPDGDLRLRELLVDRFRRRGIIRASIRWS
jgi:DNA-binding transcriptional MocR family regulator